MTLTPLLVASPAGASAADATITPVHGIPATPVDVYANGSMLLSDFTFKTFTQPLSVPAGTYTIDVRKAGAAVTSAPILSATENVRAGANLTLVADLAATGKPGLTAEIARLAMIAQIREDTSQIQRTVMGRQVPEIAADGADIGSCASAGPGAA